MKLKAVLMKVNKSLVILVMVFFALTKSVWAQSPNWTVNENNFQYTMTFVGFVNADGINLSSPNDKVAAFVNAECRGVAQLIYVASQNSYYVYLTVFSNTNNETISFKIYDSVKNNVKDVVKTVPFVTNQHIGNLFQAYSFASPALSSSAEIISLSFKDVVLNGSTLTGSKIVVNFKSGQNTTALNSIFTLSKGASLFNGTQKLVPESTVLNLTNPVKLKVLSEDQSV